MNSLNPKRPRKMRTGAYALFTADNKVLLCKLNRVMGKEKWHLVGGGIEFAESPTETLTRELYEEAAVEIDFEPKILAVISDEYVAIRDKVETDFHLVGIVYHHQFTATFPCKKTSDGGTSNGCQWVDMNELTPQTATGITIKAVAMLSKNSANIKPMSKS